MLFGHKCHICSRVAPCQPRASTPHRTSYFTTTALVWGCAREKARSCRPSKAADVAGQVPGSLTVGDDDHATKIAGGIGIEQRLKCQPSDVEVAHFAQTSKRLSLNRKTRHIFGGKNGHHALR